MRFSKLAQTAYDWFSGLMTRPATTTHEGLLKAIAMRAQAKPIRQRPRGREIGRIRPRVGRDIPVYYNPPAPTLLNRPKHWKAKETYADARRHAFDMGFVTSLGVR